MPIQIFRNLCPFENFQIILASWVDPALRKGCDRDLAEPSGPRPLVKHIFDTLKSSRFKVHWKWHHDFKDYNSGYEYPESSALCVFENWKKKKNKKERKERKKEKKRKKEKDFGL